MTETAFTFKTLTTQQVQALARSHVMRFERLLKAPFVGINEDECQRYLSLWKSILTKTEVPNDAWKRSCTAAEKQEIEDACFCGDYDKLLANPTDEKG